MKCPPEERIFWDPFCCPRCKGEKSCTVTVATVNWLDKVPNRKGLPRFVSIFTPEGEEEILSEAHQPQILRPSMYEDDEANRNEEKTSIITVSPAQHLVTHAGRCVCTDGELRCFRPGPGIWHDTDCYYSHGQHGRYYAKGEHWKSYNDECSDCYCLEGRKYTCSRTPCSSLFLCPSGKVPVFAPGDCCPSTCEDKKQVADEENSYQLPDQAFIRRVPESAQNSSDSPVAISSGGKCRPLGALVSSHNATSNVMLPSNSLVIIRRTCVSLKCVCSSEGNWVCGDYCIPCHGLPTLDGAATSLIDPVNLRTSDGCCPKCSATADREETLNFGDRYSVAITCFLALLVLTPLFVITSCCICLRYRRKLKKLRATEPKQAKFLLESGLPTHSAQSSLAVPLTISTNAEGPSTQTSLDKEPVVLSRRDSMHHPLLPTAKITDTPLSQIKFWQLSASHTCLTEVHNAPASASSEQNRSRIFEDSTPPNSPLTSSDHILKTDHDSDVSLTRQAGDATTCTSSPVSSSSPQLGKAGSTTSVGAQDTLTWRPRLRRSSTQPRTHFFPHAWKAMISKSAATTPMRDHETTPFFDTRNTSPPNLPIPEDLYELEEQCQSPPTPNSHDDHAQNSMAIDLAAISEVV
uniref:VWFC domain-containing protein n=1 Tax=Mesocestoides corti TaxID=53468 RepID=A0A5K3EGC6_MESCO